MKSLKLFLTFVIFIHMSILDINIDDTIDNVEKCLNVDKMISFAASDICLNCFDWLSFEEQRSAVIYIYSKYHKRIKRTIWNLNKTLALRASDSYAGGLFILISSAIKERLQNENIVRFEKPINYRDITSIQILDITEKHQWSWRSIDEVQNI